MPSTTVRFSTGSCPPATPLARAAAGPASPTPCRSAPAGGCRSPARRPCPTPSVGSVLHNRPPGRHIPAGGNELLLELLRCARRPVLHLDVGPGGRLPVLTELRGELVVPLSHGLELQVEGRVGRGCPLHFVT